MRALDSPPTLADLAWALVPAAPALGALLARAALHPAAAAYAPSLLGLIEHARERLSLPPGDDAHRHWEVLRDAERALAAPAVELAIEPVDDAAAGRLRVPRFDHAATDALRAIPTPVAAEAIRLAGELGAGDPSAWKAIERTGATHVARLGVHHVMLFATDDRSLMVRDIVPRDRLRTALERLAAAARRR
jgi:hypothetical protein